MPIPTNLEYQAFKASAVLTEIKEKDEEGYTYSFYARRDDPQNHYGGAFYKPVKNPYDGGSMSWG